MKRRDLFKWIASTCLVLVPGVKVVSEPKFELPSYEGMVPKGITNMDFSTGYSASRDAYGLSWDNPNYNPLQDIEDAVDRARQEGLTPDTRWRI